ncbi:MAG: O-antigen ligase family protein [Chloroflexi bacterium]|nr:O-antigen ligase family protein [Chloroflexota bacterium]
MAGATVHPIESAKHGGVVSRISRAVAAAELPLLGLAAPALIFPRGPLPLVGLVAILGLWLAQLVSRRRIAVPTPLDLPLLILLAMALESIYPSVDLGASMPKLYGIVLGVALYHAVVNGIGGWIRWWIAVAALMAGAVAVALFGLVSTAWIVGKMPLIGAVTSRIPRLVSSVDSSLGTIAGVHPNELGGSLAFLLPLPLALIFWCIGNGTTKTPRHRESLRVRLVGLRVLVHWWFAPAGALLTLLVAGSVLALTYSRSALLGLACGSLLLLGLRWRRLGYLLVGAAFLVAVALAAIGPRAVQDWVTQLDRATSAYPTAIDRPEIWNRTTYMIQDFPFTGIGLNSFPGVLDTLYPSVLAGPDARIPHAHNIYLQTAVDLGLAGLMAFVGVWLIVGWEAASAFRRAADPLAKGAVAGLGAGCLAYLVFGITDAVTLGAKPLPLLWAMVGLIVVANRLLATTKEEEGSLGDTPNRDRGRSPLDPRLLVREAGRTLWMLYWAVAILFAGMAYLVVGISISGWVP